MGGQFILKGGGKEGELKKPIRQKSFSLKSTSVCFLAGTIYDFELARGAQFSELTLVWYLLGPGSILNSIPLRG